MNISVINAWGENRGDEAMQRALIAHIWDLCPDATISIYSYGPFDLPRKVIQYSTDDLPMSGLAAFFGEPKLSTAKVFFTDLLGLTAHRQQAGKLFFRSSDLVISGPAGPYIGDTYPILNRACLARIKMVALYGKPCIITATSAGGFSKPWQNRVRRRMLERVKWWTVREPLSYEAIKALGLRSTEIEMASDIVFTRHIEFGNADINESEKEELLNLGNFMQKTTIGVTITTTPYIDDTGRAFAIEENDYILAVCRFLKSVVSLTGCQLLFFSHHYGKIQEMRIIREIVNELSLVTHCRIFPPHLNSDCQQLAMRGLAALISQRYHPSIFAMGQDIPVFCIVHQFKSSGLLDLFKYPVSMPTSISSCEEWQSAFGLFWDRRQEVKHIIARELPRVRDLAFRTVSRLRRELHSLRSLP